MNNEVEDKHCLNTNPVQRYDRGQIYIIRSPSTDEVYVGSTIQTLSKCLSVEVCKYNSGKFCSSGEIIKYGDAYIELLEAYPCDSKARLNKRENLYIRSIDGCINKRSEKIELSEEEKQERFKAFSTYNKNYKKNNREKISKKAKEYYIEHSDKLCKANSVYYEANKALVSARMKAYYQRKKEAAIEDQQNILNTQFNICL